MEELNDTMVTLNDSLLTLDKNISLLKKEIKKQIEESESLRFRLVEVENALYNS